ncbi:membrane-bound lytic murein transglycosylase D [Cycloclasticus pugetii]|nr:membrane-bound lytic murein transglycosylase D [Cycloclasticus pugetii]
MAVLNISKSQRVRRLLIVVCLMAAILSNTSLARDQEAFPLPHVLKPDVNFWLKVYTEVTTDEGFIHDNQRLNIIYERLSFTPGTSYKERQQSIKQKKKYYQDILLYLAANPSKRLDQARYRHIKALWPTGTTGEEFKEAANRLRFQLGQADRFKQGLVRAGRWQPFIKEEFQKLDLPDELAALPHVESSFRSDARSHAGAAGLWQFTRSTGRRFMRIDHVVDERLDPFLATRAAGLLLKDNHKITGTWPLALTAYNHGAAGMRRAVSATGGTDIAKIVREYKGRTFGFASRNFYNAFVAAHDIDQQPSKYFGQVQRDPPMVIQEVKLPSYYSAQGLMTAFGINNNIFKSLNPALQPTVWSNNKYIPKGYKLRVPVETGAASIKGLMARIPPDEQSMKQKPDVSYRVKRGDSLSKIAERFKVKTSQLVAINGLKSQHKIRVGQLLKLPNIAKNQLKGAHPIAQDAIFYTVRKGDRLSAIASRVGVSEANIVSLNKLKNKHYLYVGQKLRIRANPDVLSVAASAKVLNPKNNVEENSLKADPSNYRVADDGSVEVQSNETLGHFSEWLSLKTAVLRKLNKMSAQSRLRMGDRLKLDFSHVDRRQLESKRLAFHKKIQDDFFKRFSVVETETLRLKNGSSIWLLAQQQNVPLWLLRQYNTKVDLNRVSTGTRLTIPKVKKKPK